MSRTLGPRSRQPRRLPLSPTPRQPRSPPLSSMLRQTRRPLLSPTSRPASSQLLSLISPQTSNPLTTSPKRLSTSAFFLLRMLHRPKQLVRTFDESDRDRVYSSPLTRQAARPVRRGSLWSSSSSRR